MLCVTSLGTIRFCNTVKLFVVNFINRYVIFFHSKNRIAMRTFILLFLIITMLILSCKTFALSAIPRMIEMEEKLPPLQPDFGVASFGPDYQDLYNIPNIIVSGKLPNVQNVVNKATLSFTIAEDTKRIYNRTIVDRMTRSVGETKGYIVCRLGMRSRSFESNVNPIVSTLTLGVLNVFGYKAATYKDEMEIIVDVYDLNDNILGSFSALGVGTADMKLYIRYNGNSAKRMAHARAFTNAMNAISDKMLRELSALKARLAD